MWWWVITTIFFDSSALLYALTQRNQWQVGVLVDEAHNLVERGRGMYSASLDQATLKDVRKHAPAPLKRSLTRVANAWRKTLPETAALYTELGDPPSALTNALQEAIAAITEYLTGAEQGADSTLQRFYFDALRFTALADSFSEHSLFDATQDGRNSSLNLRNVVPAPFFTHALCRGAQRNAVFRHLVAASLFFPACWACPITTSGWMCPRRSARTRWMCGSRHISRPATRIVPRQSRPSCN